MTFSAGRRHSSTVSITAVAGSTLTGTVTVTADANDNVGVTGVQFLLDGANLVPRMVRLPTASAGTARRLLTDRTLLARAPRCGRQRHHLAANHDHDRQLADHGVRRGLGFDEFRIAARTARAAATPPRWSMVSLARRERQAARLTFDGVDDYLRCRTRHRSTSPEPA